MTPGWRKVRSFFNAFRASGKRDRFEVMSKEKMLHRDPSSCLWVSEVLVYSGEQWFPYPFRPVTQGPYRLINVDFVAERVRERGPSGYSRRDGRLEEVHRGGAVDGEVRFDLKAAVSGV